MSVTLYPTPLNFLRGRSKMTMPGGGVQKSVTWGGGVRRALCTLDILIFIFLEFFAFRNE